MSSPDFWNLAGRAGRLRETFRGNIWCLQPTTWGDNPLEGAQLSEIKSAFRTSLEDQEIRDGLVAVLDNTTPLSIVKEGTRVEQVLGKVFAEFTCENMAVSESPYAANADKQQLAHIDAKCRDMQARIGVPTEVCKRNSAISPLSMDELWRRFQRGPIENLIPIDPIQGGALDRMREIFKVIDDIFIHSGNNSYMYFSTLAYYWVQGETLKDMIANHLRYYKISSERTPTNKAIREFLESLEQMVRFTYVKYLKAYIDALSVYLSSTGQEELQRRISPLHLYIEFGARDKVLVMLMSLGLSRTTAIFLRTAITSQAEISRDECWAKLTRLTLKVLAIPEVCKTEIRQLTGQP